MSYALVSLALGGLGRDALKVATSLGLAILLALAFAIATLMGALGAAAPGQPLAAARVGEIPPDQLAVMRQAAALCGLPWEVLAAVARVESEFGRNMATSSKGAIGYGQFLPATWAAYGRGGNPYDYRDALPAMARYLCASGGPRDLRRALYAYNHDTAYVDDVLALAARYGRLATDASAAPSAASGPSAQVLARARAQIGKPYVWGGASPQTSFDCSGLVQWAYRQLGVALPRTAQQQYGATARLTPDQLQPGDLVFFRNTYPSAEPITHVGIYVGNGRMINAPTQGDVIREMPVFTGYWGAHYAGAGRVRR
jgi:cell wall-associated NlpC family hydrolase